MVKHLPFSRRDAAPQRRSVRPSPIVLGRVLQHDEPVGQLPTPHVVHANRLSIEVSSGRYASSRAFVPDLATGGPELMEIRCQQAFQAWCVSPAFQAQRLAFG